MKVTQSLAIGSMRFQEALETSSELVEQVPNMIEQQVNSAVAAITGLLPLRRIRRFIAIGGDVRWAAKQAGKSSASPGLINVPPKNLKSLITQYEAIPPSAATDMAFVARCHCGLMKNA
jgi:hypothetical protein